MILQTLLVLMSGAQTPVANPTTGVVIAEVKCGADPSQSYALYLPHGYTPDRPWPVIFAFDPGGRGRNPVDRYQAAAEQYGFIVAGSNNSRNGSPGPTTRTAGRCWSFVSDGRSSPRNRRSPRILPSAVSRGACSAL